MWLDERLEFVDAGDASREAGTENVGDVIDLGIARDIGNGQKQAYLVIQVTTAFDGGGATNGITQFQLVSDAVATPATDGNQSIHLKTDEFVAASELTLGKQFVFALPSGHTGPGHGYERYLGLQVVQSVEGEDDGAIDAFITFDRPGWVSVAQGQN